jgi:hypothetical protein
VGHLDQAKADVVLQSRAPIRRFAVTADGSATGGVRSFVIEPVVQKLRATVRAGSRSSWKPLA